MYAAVGIPYGDRANFERLIEATKALEPGEKLTVRPGKLSSFRSCGMYERYTQDNSQACFKLGEFMVYGFEGNYIATTDIDSYEAIVKGLEVIDAPGYKELLADHIVYPLEKSSLPYDPKWNEMAYGSGEFSTPTDTKVMFQMIGYWVGHQAPEVWYDLQACAYREPKTD